MKDEFEDYKRAVNQRLQTAHGITGEHGETLLRECDEELWALHFVGSPTERAAAMLTGILHVMRHEATTKELQPC